MSSPNGCQQSGYFNAGNYSVHASYTGDGNNLPSTSNSIQVNVSPDVTTANLLSSANPAVVGTNVTFTMVITGNHATPSGTVNFYNGSPFTAANLMGTVTLDATGTATISTSSLAVGTYSIYGGNRAGQSGLALRLRTLHRPWHAAGSLRVHGRRDAGRDFDQRLGIGTVRLTVTIP